MADRLPPLGSLAWRFAPDLCRPKEKLWSIRASGRRTARPGPSAALLGRPVLGPLATGSSGGQPRRTAGEGLLPSPGNAPVEPTSTTPERASLAARAGTGAAQAVPCS